MRIWAPEKVDEFCGGVDFSLDGRLGLAQHGGGVQLRPPWSGHEGSSLFPDVQSFNQEELF